MQRDLVIIISQRRKVAKKESLKKRCGLAPWREKIIYDTEIREL